MGITMVKSTNYLNGLLNSIKALMEENNITEIPLDGTIFAERAGWKRLLIVDGELRYEGREGIYTFEWVHRWDIVALQEIVYGKAEKMFVLKD